MCNRLRFAREEILKMTQAACAEELGLDRGSLANYEIGRTALRYEIALRFCRQFIISEEWLATGKFEACYRAAESNGVKITAPHDIFESKIFPRQCADLLLDPVVIRLRPGTLFSRAFADSLAKRYYEVTLENFFLPLLNLASSDDSRLALRFLYVVHERHFLLLNAENFERFIDAQINRTGEQWKHYTLRATECAVIAWRSLMKYPMSAQELEEMDWLREIVGVAPWWGDQKPIALANSTGTESQKKSLTAVHASVKHESVKALWPNLKKKLQEATAEPGGKTALADFLKVKLASVSQWLTANKDNAREPGAETALKMQYFLEHPELRK